MPLGWIWTENLRPFLVLLARLVGSDFDESDWTACEVGVVWTDSEADRWFDYPVGPTLVYLALEPGAPEMITIRVDQLPEQVRERLEWTVDIVRDYQVRDRH